MSWRGRARYPPIRTVNSPKMITPPCAVMSVIRAAGKPQTRTVKDPNTITSGGPTHVNMSVMRACGSPPVSTVTAQGGRMGPPTCGTSTVSIGQTCMSVARAAGNMLGSISRLGHQRKPVVFRRRCGTHTATAACTECTSTLQSAAPGSLPSDCLYKISPSARGRCASIESPGRDIQARMDAGRRRLGIPPPTRQIAYGRCKAPAPPGPWMSHTIASTTSSWLSTPRLNTWPNKFLASGAGKPHASNDSTSARRSGSPGHACAS